MADKAILCYISSWSHEFSCPHMYSMVGSLLPGSFEMEWGLVLLFFLRIANPFSSFCLCPNSSHGVLAQLDGWMHASAFVLVRLLKSYTRLLIANSSWHQQLCLGLVSGDGMDL